MKAIRTAVIGAGRWGRNLVRVVRESRSLRLAAVCDRDSKRLAEFADAKHCDDPRRVLEDPRIDAVIIATPPDSHAELVEAALVHGKHVLCEKPLAFDSATCRKLGQEAEACGLCLMVDFTPVYLDNVQEAADEIRSSEIEAIHCVRTSSRVPAHEVDILWDLAVHDLAVLAFWLGDLGGRWRAFENECEAHLQARRPDGTNLSIATGRRARSVREITVRFRGGYRLFVSQDQQFPEPLAVVAEQFAECIRTEGHPVCDAALAAQVADALNDALTSQISPEWESLPSPGSSLALAAGTIAGST
jgi:predicted dehydrogenase